MQLIKLGATTSTNSYLKELMAENDLLDFTVISTNQQTKGRGQRHSLWLSEPGKNLTVSILKKYLEVTVSSSFLISIAVSLAILDVLKDLGITDSKVKWPNDILSGKFKIGGILIENAIAGIQIKNSIIGLGLNVNQKNFEGLPNASSLLNIAGYEFDLDTLLRRIITRLKLRLSVDSLKDQESLKREYHENLFKINEVSQFIDYNNNQFTGKIIGVTNDWKLKVETFNQLKQEFSLKEITLLY